jgi:hypothetical protein
MPGMSDNVTSFKLFISSGNLTILSLAICIFIILVGLGIFLIFFIRTKWKSIWSIFGLLLISFGLFMIFVYSSEFRDILTASASVFAVAFSAYAIKQTQISIKQTEQIREDTAKQQQKEYKEKLLDELKQWALELWRVNLPTIPDFAEITEARKLGEDAIRELKSLAEGKESFRKNLVLLEGSYSRVMVEKVFKTQFEDLFWVIDREVPTLAFLETGLPFADKSSSIANEVVEEIQKIITSGELSREQLLELHKLQLQDTIFKLCGKIAELKAELL